MKKTYNNYVDIDRQLEILKLERDISYYRIIDSSQRISSSFAPINLLKYGIGTISNSVGNSRELKILIFSSVLKFFVKKLFNRNKNS